MSLRIQRLKASVQQLEKLIILTDVEDKHDSFYLYLTLRSSNKQVIKTVVKLQVNDSIKKILD